MAPMTQLDFPAFLTPAFDARALELVESTIAVVDPRGSILWRNPAWDRFAKENGCEREFSSYFDGIAPPLGDFYRSVFAKALATGEVYEQDYECSSATTYRLFHCRALPVDAHGLVVEHSLVAESPHERVPVEALESRYVGASGKIHQCGNCRRVKCRDREHAWHWVPRWVERPHPLTSHVICPACVGYYWGRRIAKRTRR
jgi:hypothetical protein